MKNTLSVLFVVIVLTGCGPVPQPATKEESSGITKDITYTKDLRTGVCFAVYTRIFYVSREHTFFTSVPCEKIPQNLLK